MPIQAGTKRRKAVIEATLIVRDDECNTCEDQAHDVVAALRLMGCTAKILYVEDAP